MKRMRGHILTAVLAACIIGGMAGCARQTVDSDAGTETEVAENQQNSGIAAEEDQRTDDKSTEDKETDDKKAGNQTEDEQKDSIDQGTEMVEDSISESEWKDAYIAEVEKIAQDVEVPLISVILADLDEDGIPELLVDTMPGYEHSGIYTYQDGEVVYIYDELCYGFCKIGDHYFYTNVRLAADDPLAIYGISKIDTDIVKALNASFYVSEDTGEPEGRIYDGDNPIADNYVDALAAMEQYGYNIIVNYDGQYYYFDYTTETTENYEWVNCDGYEDDIDLTKIEEYIQSYI